MRCRSPAIDCCLSSISRKAPAWFSSNRSLKSITSRSRCRSCSYWSTVSSAPAFLLSFVRIACSFSSCLRTASFWSFSVCSALAISALSDLIWRLRWSLVSSGPMRFAASRSSFCFFSCSRMASSLARIAFSLCGFCTRSFSTMPACALSSSSTPSRRATSARRPAFSAASRSYSARFVALSSCSLLSISRWWAATWCSTSFARCSTP
mmetsp:Transcript_19627/g.66788  ORF Transcript_19627/g.66788 Transcript_19627/m.66788 type:complete len:208 (+) Transcript_19627:1252-1875(+)